MASLLVIGAGDVGLRMATGLLQQARILRLTLADRAPERIRGQVAMLASCYDCSIELVALDGTDHRAVTGLLQKSRPDLVLQSASLFGPWSIIGRDHPAARHLCAAGIGVQLPIQLPVLTTVMRAVRDLGLDIPVANVSVPDIAHPILQCAGLAPTIGLGNVSMLHFRTRAALRARRDRRGELAAQSPLIRLIGHHHHVYGVMQCQPPEDPTLAVRVYLGEEGRRDDAAAYEGTPFAPGPVYNVLTAAAGIPVLTALLPGADPLRFCAPAPLGLPGGYPVSISNGRVALDLPAAVSEEEAVSFNRQIGTFDGIDTIDGDGTVHFTRAAMAHGANVDPRLCEPLRPTHLEERTALLVDILAGIT